MDNYQFYRERALENKYGEHFGVKKELDYKKLQEVINELVQRIVVLESTLPPENTITINNKKYEVNHE